MGIYEGLVSLAAVVIGTVFLKRERSGRPRNEVLHIGYLLWVIPPLMVAGIYLFVMLGNGSVATTDLIPELWGFYGAVVMSGIAAFSIRFYKKRHPVSR